MLNKKQQKFVNNKQLNIVAKFFHNEKQLNIVNKKQLQDLLNELP